MNTVRVVVMLINLTLFINCNFLFTLEVLAKMRVRKPVVGLIIVYNNVFGSLIDFELSLWHQILPDVVFL